MHVYRRKHTSLYNNASMYVSVCYAHTITCQRNVSIFEIEEGAVKACAAKEIILTHLNTFPFSQSVSGRWYLQLLWYDCMLPKKWYFVLCMKCSISFVVESQDVHKGFTFHLLTFPFLIPSLHLQILLVLFYSEKWIWILFLGG